MELEREVNALQNIQQMRPAPGPARTRQIGSRLRLKLWKMEKEKRTKKGSKTYTYWMASWREGNKVRNVHLGSSRKIDAEAARQKAQKMKAEALGLRPSD